MNVPIEQAVRRTEPLGDGGVSPPPARSSTTVVDLAGARSSRCCPPRLRRALDAVRRVGRPAARPADGALEGPQGAPARARRVRRELVPRLPRAGQESSTPAARLDALVAERYEVVKVDVGRFDKNLDFAKLYGEPIKKGIPSVVVVTPVNEVVYQTKAGELADARSMGPGRHLRLLQGQGRQAARLLTGGPERPGQPPACTPNCLRAITRRRPRPARCARVLPARARVAVGRRAPVAPRREVPPETTFGPFGIAERLNWLISKKRRRKTPSHFLISASCSRVFRVSGKSGGQRRPSASRHACHARNATFDGAVRSGSCRTGRSPAARRARSSIACSASRRCRRRHQLRRNLGVEDREQRRRGRRRRTGFGARPSGPDTGSASSRPSR